MLSCRCAASGGMGHGVIAMRPVAPFSFAVSQMAATHAPHMFICRSSTHNTHMAMCTHSHNTRTHTHTHLSHGLNVIGLAYGCVAKNTHTRTRTQSLTRRRRHTHTYTHTRMCTHIDTHRLSRVLIVCACPGTSIAPCT